MSPAETHESKSTGPRTPEGKAVSCMNAMRHGLTGRVVVLPSEDMNVYRAFCEKLMADLAPETALERQFAQTFCDTQWRLNRARSYEDSMLALGHFEHAASIGIDDPQALAALTAAKAFRENSRAFVNLSLYEQRLNRQQKEALRQLHDLQAKRLAARQAAHEHEKGGQEKAEHEKATHNSHKTKPEPVESTPGGKPGQFVYSTPEIVAAPSHQNPLDAAENTESPLKQAA